MTDGEEKYRAQGDKKKPFFSALSSSYSDAAEKPGSQIGPYKLVRILGEGGYGVVYLAEQQIPVRRHVALKIVKLGMDTKQVIARFEAERQALAILDHPNIAHVYEAGTTETGRPYFVMEFVKGSVITEYCDWLKLSIEGRLELFLDVCNAIQYAHQKGIIHRDIKPSNILVSVVGTKVVPKIIDFGVAKALNQPLTERTLYTEQGQFIGTPEYMSPEQADMATNDIDTRSDIYSLGVALYELLTGVLPFDPETLRGSGVDRLRQIIRNEEPRTPSTRLSGLGEDAKQIATNRRTEVGTLAKRLHRELEWIPMMAMRKEQAHRYQSVSDLANDIRNYLNGNPLIAGPESVIYRMKKFVLRRRWSVAAIMSVLVTLIVGLVVSSMLYVKAEDARTKEANQLKIANTQRNRAVKAEQKAEKRLVDLYERQGREYMESGDLDKALVVLSEAYCIDDQRSSLKFLLAECMSKHENPAFRKYDQLIPWDKSASVAPNSPFSVSPDRTCVAFVDESLDLINVFDATTGKLMVNLPARAVTRLVFTPGSRHIIVKAEQDNTHHTLKVFSIQNGKEEFSIKRQNVDIDKLYQLVDYTLPEHGQLAKVYDSLCMSPDGDWFAFVDVVDSDGALKPEISLWDIRSDEFYRAKSQHFGSLITLMAFKPESSYGAASELCTLDCNGLCQCWDLLTLKPARQFSWSCKSVIIGPKNMLSFKNGKVKLLDRKSNRAIREFPSIIWAGFSPDFRRLVTEQISMSSRDTGRIAEYASTNLWDTDDGRHIAELAGKNLRNWHFTPDSKRLITEYDDRHIKLWSVEDGSSIFEIPPEQKQIVSDISVDSCRLITCSSGKPKTIKTWNLKTGSSFEIYQEEITCKDIAVGWLSVGMDSVFSFSHNRPIALPRFNATGSCLITASGLQDITVHNQPERILSLVKAHIPIRLENGDIRSATTKEMLIAKLYYCIIEKGRQDYETIGTILDLAAHEIQANQLEETSEVLKQLQSVLPLHNNDLAVRVSDILSQLSNKYHCRGDLKERSGKYAEAIADYKSALSFCADDVPTLISLAMLQATCPDCQLRDDQAAFENAKEACKLTEWKQWECLSTYAVVCATMNKFLDAIHYQKKAIDLLPSEKRDKWKANYEERLRLFQLNKLYERYLFWNLPTKNMIAWWKFDQAEGCEVADSSGNGLNGKMVESVRIVWDVDRGHVLSIGSEGGYVDCGDDSAFNISGPITIMAWIKVQAIHGEWQSIISKRDFAWRLNRTPNAETLIFSCDAQGTDQSFIEGRTNINDERWHHVVATYDRSTLALYVDSMLDNYRSVQGAINTRPSAVWIGRDAWDVLKESSRAWNGLIDDVRIYNRALSSDEIHDLYNITK